MTNNAPDLAAIDHDAQTALGRLPAWNRTDAGIAATFSTGSFSRGVQLVDRIGELADAADHHPDVLLTYPSVTVTLVTHDAGSRVTALDTDLAARVTDAAAELGVRAA